MTGPALPAVFAEAAAAAERKDEAAPTTSTMIHRHHRIYARLQSLGGKYSMLHPDLLTVLYFLGRYSLGNVLEIGPFLGGSTMATALGLRAGGSKAKFVTVERGGAMERELLGTTDIVRDLQQNLRDNDLADRVHLIIGFSLGDETIAAVRAQLPPRSVTLLIVDADGEVRSVLDRYQDLLCDVCWVVIDDYCSTGIATGKSALTKPQVDAAVASGEIEELDFYGWETWVGRWRWSPNE